MKPTLPKGTRDFTPSEVLKRKYIFNTIETVFKKYGFAPIETPAMESLNTLTGKYGDEGDQLLFKVLNNGDYLKKANQEALSNLDSNALVSSISKRGLRYDLTVPFARFVVMNQHQLQFPFKRYQIQPVWRADRPQKGRYQEFYQCDVDVVGSDSLMYEAELVNIYSEAFQTLGLEVVIQVNNRKVLFGIAEQAGIADKFIDMTVAIDKLDKIGKDGVRNEMDKKGIPAEAIDKIFELLQCQSLDELAESFDATPEGQNGIRELKEFHEYLDISKLNNVKFEITLARGLGYYTGCIFEVKIDETAYPETKMGSIGGGGRYADLTATFGLKGVSGVGVSFGAERIYDVMEELDLFPDSIQLNPDLLFVCFSKENHLYAFKCAQKLRSEGLVVDVYPDYGKMGKQMKYADQRGITYTAIIGDDEMNSDKITIKNLVSGEQKLMSIQETLELLT
jgi:histidyl-tRNA synthetase